MEMFLTSNNDFLFIFSQSVCAAEGTVGYVPLNNILAILISTHLNC